MSTCQATCADGYRCTLHEGHRGTHYDSLTDASFTNCQLCGDGAGLSEPCPCCGAQPARRSAERRAWTEGVEALEAAGIRAPGLSYRGGVARVMGGGTARVAVEDPDKARAYRAVVRLALRLAADEAAA